jgi:hypothetical protein
MGPSPARPRDSPRRDPYPTMTRKPCGRSSTTSKRKGSGPGPAGAGAEPPPLL